MPKAKVVTTSEGKTEPAALAAQYLRLFARHLPAIGDFDQFVESLKTLVGEDSYLLGVAQLEDASAGHIELPDFEKLGEEETVVSVCGEGGHYGYIKYTGKEDGSAFDAGDMHLMGAIAGFISLLTTQARDFREQNRAAKVFQHLINQLPLGVVCYGGDGVMIAQSKLATRLLGDAGGEPLSALAMDKKKNGYGREQLHLEVNGKLLYAEGRRLKVEDELTVTAFVLYDLSESQQKLTSDLEREAYRSESRGAPFSLAVLQAGPNATPGELFRFVKSSASALGLSESCIHPLDAFQCACLFSGKEIYEVRTLLRNAIRNKNEVSVLRLSLQRYAGEESNDAPAQQMLQRIEPNLEESASALLPHVLVLDPYSGVSESLEMAAGEVSRVSLSASDSVEETVKQIRSGFYDGLFVSLDDCEPEALASIQEAAGELSDDFRLFYLSYQQTSLARRKAGLSDSAILFQKPFRAEEIAKCLKQQFNLS